MGLRLIAPVYVQHQYDVYGGCRVYLSVYLRRFQKWLLKEPFHRRAKKGDYVISKTIAGVFCGILMLIAYFIGSMLGGAMAGLSFDLGDIGTMNIAMCISKKTADYKTMFFRNGVYVVAKMWFEGGCKEPKEQMGEIVKREYLKIY